MTIGREIAHISGLARLGLHTDELAQIAHDCKAILEYFEAVRHLDVSKAEPSGALESAAPLRDDIEKADRLERPVEELAPEWRDGFFVLPRLASMDESVTGDGE